MASVQNVSVKNSPQANGRRYVRYRYELLDNLGESHTSFVGPKSVANGFDAQTDAQGVDILSHMIDAERQEIIQNIESDPFHTDMGGWYEKTMLKWDGWDNHFVHVAMYFWSLLNHLDILPFDTTWGRVSTTDKKALLVIDNQTVSDMNADMQIAVDTQSSLDLYTPYFEEDL